VQTALAVRQAIWCMDESALGMFAGFRVCSNTDNGRDFTSHNLERVAAH
jgi:hypothetical protein